MGSSASGPRTKAKNQINRRFLVSFLDVFKSDEFEKKFNYKNMNVNMLYRWLCSEAKSKNPGDAIREIYDVCTTKLEKGKKNMSADMMMAGDTSEMDMMEVLNTQQVRQILRAALAIHSRVYTLFDGLFKNSDVSPKLVIACSYLTAILGSSSKLGPAVSLGISVASGLECILFFHCVRVFLEEQPGRKSETSIPLSHIIGTRVGLVVQKMCYCWKRLCSQIKSEKVGKFSALLMPYIIFEHDTGMFRVLNSREEGFSNAEQTRSLENVRVVKEQHQVHASAWNRSNEMDSAVRDIINMFFNHLNDLIGKSYLYQADDRSIRAWDELKPYAIPSNITELPYVFHMISPVTARTLDIVVPVNPTIQEVPATIDVDDEMDITPAPKQGENDNRKMGRTPSEDGDMDGIPAKRMKNNPPIEVTVRTGGRSELSPEANKAYDVINKEMVQHISCFDGDFRDLPGFYMDTVGGNLSGNVDLILMDPPYNVRRESSKKNASHDIFTNDDMEDVVNLAVDMLKPGGHGIIFCSHLQFHSWYNLLNAETEDVPDYSNDVSGNTVKLDKVFGVEPCGLQFINGAGNYGNPARNGLGHVKNRLHHRFSLRWCSSILDKCRHRHSKNTSG